MTANVESRDFAIAVGAPSGDGSSEAKPSSVAPFTPAFSIPAPRPAPSATAKSGRATASVAGKAVAAPDGTPGTTKPPATQAPKSADGVTKPDTTTAEQPAAKPAVKVTKSASATNSSAKRSSISTLMQRFD